MFLVEEFLGAAAAARDRLAALPGLESRLQELIATGRAAWPDVHLDESAFMRHLGERLSESPDPSAALDGVHAADLFLACGCAHGDAQALLAFEERLLGPLTGYLRQREAAPASADEIKQIVRTHLLVSTGRGLPRIASYSGQGPLAAWLRIVAAREAAQLRRRQKEQPSLDANHPLQMQSGNADPELAYLKTRYRAELEEAFRATLAALAPRERTILRLHFLDGLNAEAIAAAYKVSKRTAERWLAQARRDILAETRRLLADRLQLAPSQLDTLMGLVQSEIDVSIYEILKDPPAP